jgi:hypothetical protein
MRPFHLRVLLALLVIGVVIYWRLGPSIKERPDVLAQVQKLSQLATVRYTVQRIVTLAEEKQPVGSESIVLIVQARVEAGVDLSSLQSRDVVTSKDGGVTIQMPHAQILNVAIDEKDTKVWDRQKTWWAPWIAYSLDLEKRARMTGLESAKESAIQMGILAASETNAETSVRSLLQLAGVKSVTFAPPASN